MSNITKAAQDALAELADWHWSQAATLRKAASTSAMDKPEPVQSSLTRMADWHDAQKSLIRAALQPAVPVVEAFAEGWRMAADWANRDDLLPDMDSPQYAKERDERLAELRPAVEPMGDGALALLADVTPVEHDDSNGPGSVECPACSAYMHMSWKAGVRTDEIEQLPHDADCPAEWARRQLAKGITAKAEDAHQPAKEAEKP